MAYIPPIFHEYNKKNAAVPPNSGSGGDWRVRSDGVALENFHLRPPPPPVASSPRTGRTVPPQILRLGGDGNKFSLICPPQTHDQVGAPGLCEPRLLSDSNLISNNSAAANNTKSSRVWRMARIKYQISASALYPNNTKLPQTGLVGCAAVALGINPIIFDTGDGRLYRRTRPFYRRTLLQCTCN